MGCESRDTFSVSFRLRLHLSQGGSRVVMSRESLEPRCPVLSAQFQAGESEGGSGHCYAETGWHSCRSSLEKHRTQM